MFNGVKCAPYQGDSRPALAVQQLNIHFCRQGGGVKLFDHLYRGASVTSKGEQIDVATKYQPEGNGGMAQAVKAAVCAMRPFFQPQ